jgi:hypothetical protein
MAAQPDVQSFIRQRSADLGQLADALKSGDLNGAQQAYQALVSLGQQGPFKNGTPFGAANRAQDFQAVGTALQAGDLAGASQALEALRQTYLQTQPPVTPPTGSSVGDAAVVNLSSNQ